MRKKKKKAISPVLIIIPLILIVFLFIVGSALIERYTPSKERMDLASFYNLTEESQVAITLNNTVLEDTFATMIDGHVYLDYKFVRNTINPRFYWDTNENILLYTTADNVISAEADSTTYSIGKSSNDYTRTIVKATATSAWVDIDFVKEYSDFTYLYFDSPSRLVITNEWKEITVSTLKKDTEVRYKGGIKSPILCDVKKGDVLTILEVDEKFTKVCTADGITGYVKSNLVKNTEAQTLVSEYVLEQFNHIKKEEPINLLWHAIYSTSGNSQISTLLSETKGVNVVSPTWFRIKDNNGNVQSFASMDYVNYCHSHGVDVWGLINNLEVPGIDTAYVLTHTSTRQNLVNQLVALALQYNLDGINVDIEQISESEVYDGYIQFLRELSIKCENNDIVLSTDVYPPASYNNVYRYEQQADFVDYVILMAYDQHYGQQSGEGSVASLEWVNETVQNILAKNIPSEQLVLGIPFYSRLWELKPAEDSSEYAYTIKESELGMTASSNWMNNNVGEDNMIWLDDCGQWYGEVTYNDTTYKMWLEDATSIEEKLKLTQNYSLAGAAFWKYDLEKASIWDTIIKYIN